MRISGQIRRSRIKLAMAVGTNRYHVVEEIVPRHFVQTAMKAGIGKFVIEVIIAEVAAAMHRALDDVMDALPVGFLASVAKSIADGARARLRVIG